MALKGGGNRVAGDPETAPYADFHFAQGRSFAAIFMPGSVATVGTSKTDR